MEATLKTTALKHFTKALTCLSKYGDELTFQATDEGLSISSTNSSKSAYGRFVFPSEVFVKYRVGFKMPGSTWSTTPSQGTSDVRGEVPIRVLLSIFKGRTFEKSIEKVDLEIYDGPRAGETHNREIDELESRLVIRLHCNKEVVKTHRLFLNIPEQILGPRIPESENESLLRIGPDAVKDILEHFAHSYSGQKGKGGKSKDVQLVWEFGGTKVKVKSHEAGSVDQVATVLTIDASEFDQYQIPDPPISMAWHLKEFSATITLAESLNLPLELRFTEPSAPLFIEIDTHDVEGETYDTFFAIATSQTEFDDENGDIPAREAEKRPREETNITDRRPSKKKPMKVVEKSVGPAAAASQVSHRSQVANGASRPVASTSRVNANRASTQNSQVPLFIPGSQLTQAEQDVLQESGWGDGHMDYDEFAAMMADDGEELAAVMSSTQRNQADGQAVHRSDEDNAGEEDSLAQQMSEMLATQQPKSTNFEPLFDD